MVSLPRRAVQQPSSPAAVPRVAASCRPPSSFSLPFLSLSFYLSPSSHSLTLHSPPPPSLSLPLFLARGRTARRVRVLCKSAPGIYTV